MNDGGPAFPQATMTGTFNDQPLVETYGGMSLRDWFAGQALAGLLAGDDEGGTWEKWALSAYNAADAMLARRLKGGQL